MRDKTFTISTIQKPALKYKYIRKKRINLDFTGATTAPINTYPVVRVMAEYINPFGPMVPADCQINCSITYGYGFTDV